MKKLYLLSFVLALFSSLNAQNIQPPNAGFESWITNRYYEDPVGFYTSNDVIYNPNDSTVGKTTDAYLEKYAVKIQTKLTSQGIIPGFIIYGKINQSITAIEPNPYFGGFQYTKQPDSLTGYFKYNLSGGDSAVIFVILKNNGGYEYYHNFTIYGTQNTYKKLGFKLSSLQLPPDTAIVGIMSSNPNNPSPYIGNWIQADNIGFVVSNTTTLIPNGDFESWQPVTRNEPAQWNDINSYVALKNQAYITKSSSPHSGNSALQIVTSKVDIQNDSIPACFATTGKIFLDSNNNYSFSLDNLKGGFKLDNMPDSVSLWYKYMSTKPLSTDSALFIAVFKNSNSSFSFSETLPAGNNSYKRVSFPIAINANPDSANILISSSKHISSDDTFHSDSGNTLLIDDIAFIYNNLINTYSVSGTVTYDNTVNTPIVGTVLYLENSENKVIDSTITIAGGAYLFPKAKPDGSYKIIAGKTVLKWAGCNSIDALTVLRFYVGLIKTFGGDNTLRKSAADVTLDTKINSIDALSINRRYVSLIKKFNTPDWLYDSPAFNIAGAAVIQNFKAICAGDVNASR